MLVKEVIQRIQSLYSKGVQSDDSRLSDRHIYSKMITVRAKLLRQRKNKNQKIAQSNYQTLNCVELIEAERHECPCLPPVGCTILKTKYKLPNVINGLDNHIIQSVTSVDGSLIYSETSWKEKKYKSGSKYTSKKPDFYIRDGYMYITHKTGPKIISITGLFEEPLDAYEYPNYCDNNCKDCDSECISPLDREFPFSADQIETLVEISSIELLQVFNSNIEDISNNRKDNTVEQSK